MRLLLLLLLLPTAARAQTLARPPAILVEPDVVYPESALRELRGGEVVLTLVVDAEGRVSRVDVASAPAPDLAWSAMGAATNLQFSPALFCVHDKGDDRCDVPLPVSLTWRTTFQLPLPFIVDKADDEEEEGDADVPVQELVVQGRAVAVDRFDAGRVTPATVLTELELRSVRGLPLADAIAEVPGVNVLASGPNVHKPVLHGQYGRRLVTLVDGVRHESQEWGLDHAPEVDPFAAASITVVKGPAGVRYGPDAVGGAVLLAPAPLREDVGVDGSLTLVGALNGFGGTLATRVDAVPALLPDLTLRVDANMQKSAALATPDYVLGNTGSEGINAGLTVGYRAEVLDQALRVKLSLRRYQQISGVCFCQVSTTPEGLQDSINAKIPPNSGQWTTSYDLERPRQEVTHDLLLLRTETDVGGAGTVSLTYNLQRDVRAEFDQVRGDITGAQYSFDLTTHALDFVYAHAPVPLGTFRLDGVAGLHGDVQRHSFAGLTLIPNYDRMTGGVFASERLHMPRVAVGDVDVEAGARLDGLQQTAALSALTHQALRRRGQVAGDECEEAANDFFCSRSLPALTASVGARWTFDVVALSADLSQATRFPDVDELYLAGRAPSMPVFGLGKANLAPETTTQFSLGLLVDAEVVDAEVQGFSSSVDNYISFAPDGNVTVTASGAFPQFSSRSTDARFFGADAYVELFPDDLLSLGARGSFVNGLDLVTGGFLPFVPPPRGAVSLALHVPDVVTWPTKDTHASVTATAIGQQLRSDASSDFAPPPDGVVLWGASLGTTVVVGGLDVHVGLEGKNLLDARYRDALSLLRFFADQPGREVWLRVQVDAY